MTHYIKTSDLVDNLHEGLRSAIYDRGRCPSYAKKLRLLHEGAIAALEILIEHYTKNPGEELIIDGETQEDSGGKSTQTD